MTDLIPLELMNFEKRLLTPAEDRTTALSHLTNWTVVTNTDSRLFSLWFCLLTSCSARSLEEQTWESDDDDEIRRLAPRTRTRRWERPLLTLPPDLLPPTSRDRYSVPFSSSSNFYLWMAREREGKRHLYSTSLDTTLRRDGRKFILMKFQSWPFIFLVREREREREKSVTNTYFVSLRISFSEVTISAPDGRSWFLTASEISFLVTTSILVPGPIHSMWDSLCGGTISIPDANSLKTDFITITYKNWFRTSQETVSLL